MGTPQPGGPPSGRNRLELRPARDGGLALVKLSPVPAEGLGREAHVLGGLDRSSLRFAVPTLRAFSARRGALAVGWVPHARSLYAIHVGRRGLPQPLARGLGDALASLHQSAPGTLTPTPAPGELVRCFAWPSVAWYAALNPASLALLSRVQAAPGAYAGLIALYEAACGAHGLCPVHGDFRHPNLLRARRGWLFVDWEMAGLSDPASDVGSAIGEAVNAMVAPRSHAEQLTRAAVRRWLSAFWKGYAGAAPVDRGFGERAVRWAGEALLRRAYSEAHYDARFDVTTERVIAAAVELLTRPAAWKRGLLG